MSSPANGGALPRPRQVTMAGWLIMVGSVFVLLLVFERMAGINSLDTREAAERVAAEAPGLGMDTQGVLAGLRVLLMVAGAAAAAAAILGFHVLRRSRGARLAVSVLAVPLFLSGLVAGGFLSSLVAGAAVLLWLEPARDWFDGRPPRQPEPPAERRPEATSYDTRPSGAPVEPAETTNAPTSTGPRPHHGFGTLPATSPPPVAGQAWATAPPPVPPRPRRPDSVLWACVLTWVFSGLAVVLMGLTALLVASSPDLLFDQMRRQNPELLEQTGEDAIASMVYVSAAVVGVWSVVAGVLAGLVMRRVRWARVALLVSTAALSLLLVLGLLQAAFLLLVPLAACVVTFSLLLRPEVRRWVAAP